MTTVEQYNCHRGKSYHLVKLVFNVLNPSSSPWTVILTWSIKPEVCRIASLFPSFLNLCLKEEITTGHFFSSVVERENTPNATEFGKDVHSAT